MHGWQIHENGHYRDVMKWEECPMPVASGDSAVIKIKAIGLNFPDILSISGNYQFKPPLPFIPGTECMGEVVEAGPGCPFAVGDRVMTMTGIGAFAEYALAPAGSSFNVPDSMSDEDAAAFQMIYQTSYFGVKIRGNLQPGEVLLVHGGAGGVGTSAIQLGKMLGATVIATAGTDAKCAICTQAGADHTINYTDEDFVTKVKELTGGRGADVIYDPVGGDVFDKSSKCIAWNGRLLVIGFAGGRIPEIAANRILLKNMSVVGVFWGAYRMHEPHLIIEAQDILYKAYEEGTIKPIIYKNYPLSELSDALAAIEHRESYGKVVVTPEY